MFYLFIILSPELRKKEAAGPTYHLANIFYEFRKHCRSKVLKTEKGQKGFRKRINIFTNSCCTQLISGQGAYNIKAPTKTCIFRGEFSLEVIKLRSDSSQVMRVMLVGWIIGSSTRQRSLALFLVGSEFVLVFVFFCVFVFLFAIFCHHICLCLCYDGVRLTIGSNSGHRSLVAFMVGPRPREKKTIDCRRSWSKILRWRRKQSDVAKRPNRLPTSAPT